MKTVMGVVYSVMFLALLACLGACTDSEEPDTLPADVQFLEMADEHGNRYELPYRSDLSPAELARSLELSGFDADGAAIALTPMLPESPESESTDVTDAPVRSSDIEVWPLREPRAGDTNKRWINGIINYVSCWSGQSIPFPGQSHYYTIYNAFSVNGFIDPSNDLVDFDLYLYLGGTTICSSLGLGGYVDSCGGYNRDALNLVWDFQVKRFNNYDGGYRFCAYYDWAY